MDALWEGPLGGWTSITRASESFCFFLSLPVGSPSDSRGRFGGIAGQL